MADIKHHSCAHDRKSSPRVTLVSASPRRADLLAQLGIIFDVYPVDADESIAEGTPPLTAAQDIADRKARLACEELSDDRVIVAADTIVWAKGEMLGKPRDAAHAREMLTRLSGSRHAVVTGVSIRCVAMRMRRVESAVTWLYMSPMPAGEIRACVASGEGLDKAGAYAIQEEGDRFVTVMDGAHSNVVGLPLGLVSRLLREFGVICRSFSDDT